MNRENKLDEILNQGSKVKILRYLFSEKDEHTGRNIASQINMSASSVHKNLQEMRGIGVITSRKKGNAILYKLNANNYFVAKLLMPLFEKEKSIYDDIIAHIKKVLVQLGKDVVSISIFGSIAKKAETVRSDIDLLIVAKDNASQGKINELTEKLSIKIAKEFGIDVTPYILTKSEIIKRYSQKEAIIVSILNDNKLIYGEPIERILA